MKILLAEDTADLNRAVSAALEYQGYYVDQAFDGVQAIDFLTSESYDGIILDIMMPKKNGLEVLKELRGRHVMTPVLLLTAKAEVDDRVAGLDAGADDYLPKPFAIKELLARIRSMIRRHDIYEGSVLTYKGVTLDPEGFVLTAQNSVRLSIREFELMRLLLSNTDITLSTAYILEHIWKHESEYGEDSVWLYISYLKGKLLSIGAGFSIAGKKGGDFRISLSGKAEQF